MRKLFRESLNPREALAIDPKALSLSFLFGGAKENETLDSGITVVSISGPLEHHSGCMWDSYDEILARVEEAFADNETKAVVLHIDSPGGDAAGATEANKQIRKLRRKYDKPIYSYANELMCSAAYSLGCAADEVWLPDTAAVGSVGVIAALLDKTKANKKAGLQIELITTGRRKADSHDDRALTDDIRSSIQQRIDHLGLHFFTVVAKSRGTSVAAIQALQAGVFMGKSAVKAGLADGVAGWYGFLDVIGKSIGFTGEPGKSKVATNPNDENKQENGMRTSLLKLTKAKSDALAAFVTANSDKKVKASERSKLFTAYEEAAEALAKMKYSKTSTTTEKEERSGDDEDKEEEEEKAEEEEEDDDDTEASSDDDSDTDDEDEDKDEDEKAVAASVDAKSTDRLLSLAKSVTGKSDINEIFGALEGMKASKAAAKSNDKRLAKLEADGIATRVDAMLSRATKDGKVTPATVASLREQGIKDEGWLKGYLSALPKVVKSEAQPDLGAPSQTLGAQGLNADQQKMLLQASQGVGTTFDEFTKSVADTIQKKAATNGQRY